eukprot:gene15562-21014_t
MSFLKDLKFVKSTVQFTDGRKLLEGTLKRNLERSNIKDNMNKLAKQFDSPHYQLGCAMHYKNINKWVPAIFRKTTQEMMLWDSTDSPETAEAYRNDSIDAIHVFVIEDKAELHPEHSQRKPNENKRKKDKNDVVDTLHKRPIRDKNGDNTVFTHTNPNIFQQADTLYLPNDKGFIYALVLTDQGSRLVDIEPMKDRKS